MASQALTSKKEVLVKSKDFMPYRQIRALYDDETITVYQAYSAAIAIPAVREQKLHASSDFSFDRMTWIKPSWCWMMYRSGYGTKDSRQTHILALKIKHENFNYLLSLASVVNDNNIPITPEERSRPIRIQWDPERSPAIGVLPYRSIQIGISRRQEVNQKFAKEWVESIEDVTEKAAGLMEALKADKRPSIDELVKIGLMPNERVYELPFELRKVLKMDEVDDKRGDGEESDL